MVLTPASYKDSIRRFELTQMLLRVLEDAVKYKSRSKFFYLKWQSGALFRWEKPTDIWKALKFVSSNNKNVEIALIAWTFFTSTFELIFVFDE